VTAAAAIPGARVRRVNLLGLSSFWFGLYFLFQPVGTSLVPSQISHTVPHDRQPLAIGLLLGIGAFFAMTVAPLVGAFSDRLTTPWGRRRPIIVVGTAGTAASLVVMMLAGGYPQLLLGYALVQLFSNGAGAAYSGLIPDVVPDEEFGAASGWLSVMVLVGSAAGLAANVAFAGAGHETGTYLVIAIVLLATLFPTLKAARGEGLTPVPRRPRRPRKEAIRIFLAPLRRGDFAWVVSTRALNNIGISAVTPFTLFFFRDVVGVSNPDVFNPVWYLVVLVFAGPFGYLGGRFSDRWGRKRFVYWSGGLQAAVALFFIAFYPKGVGVVLLLGAVYGVGYGLYTAVDWALACDTLPDRKDAAKDMGLFHIALTLPGNIVPAIAGLVLALGNSGGGNQGYRLIFGSAAVCFVLCAVLVRNVKSVR
jgi:MFS family permease